MSASRSSQPNPISTIQRLHVLLYRMTGGFLGHRFTGGALGGRMGPARILLLTTTGSGSGGSATVPLAYFADGRDVFIAASNVGSAHSPVWYLNLKANPDVEIQVKQRRQKARAAIATSDERERLLAQLSTHADLYDQYQSGNAREIPIVLLHVA